MEYSHCTKKSTGKVATKPKGSRMVPLTYHRVSVTLPTAPLEKVTAIYDAVPLGTFWYCEVARRFFEVPIATQHYAAVGKVFCIKASRKAILILFKCH